MVRMWSHKRIEIDLFKESVHLLLSAPGSKSWHSSEAAVLGCCNSNPVWQCIRFALQRFDPELLVRTVNLRLVPGLQITTLIM